MAAVGSKWDAWIADVQAKRLRQGDSTPPMDSVEYDEWRRSLSRNDDRDAEATAWERLRRE